MSQGLIAIHRVPSFPRHDGRVTSLQQSPPRAEKPSSALDEQPISGVCMSAGNKVYALLGRSRNRRPDSPGLAARLPSISIGEGVMAAAAWALGGVRSCRDSEVGRLGSGAWCRYTYTHTHVERRCRERCRPIQDHRYLQRHSVVVRRSIDHEENQEWSVNNTPSHHIVMHRIVWSQVLTVLSNCLYSVECMQCWEYETTLSSYKFTLNTIFLASM